MNWLISNNINGKHLKDFENISAISVRSSKESYKSIAVDTARFNTESTFPLRSQPFTAVSTQNTHSRSKPILLSLNKDPRFLYKPSFTHHKRMLSDSRDIHNFNSGMSVEKEKNKLRNSGGDGSQFVISKAKHNVNTILARKGRVKRGSEHNLIGSAEFKWKN